MLSSLKSDRFLTRREEERMPLSSSKRMFQLSEYESASGSIFGKVSHYLNGFLSFFFKIKQPFKN